MIKTFLVFKFKGQITDRVPAENIDSIFTEMKFNERMNNISHDTFNDEYIYLPEDRNFDFKKQLVDSIENPPIPVPKVQPFCPKLTVADRMRDIIKERYTVHYNEDMMPIEYERRDRRALETLKLIIGEEKYRLFLKKRFVSVENKQSKNTYKIPYASGKHIDVFNGGNQIASLCIMLRGDYTPVDALVVKCLLAMSDEDRLWNIANKHTFYPKKKEIPQPLPRLTEILENVKKIHKADKKMYGAWSICADG